MSERWIGLAPPATLTAYQNRSSAARAVRAIFREPVGEDDRVHRPGAGAADAFETDSAVFENPVEHGPCERAMGAAALQCNIDVGGFLRNGLTPLPWLFFAVRP